MLFKALLFFLTQLSAEDNPTRIYIEAEDCQGLQRLAWDNEELDGWYARVSTCRYYGAPGRTCHAAIHENATKRTISQKLQKPVPAGKYNVFLRTLGPRHVEEGKSTSVKVALGGQELVFDWNQVIYRDDKQCPVKNDISATQHFAWFWPSRSIY